MLTDDTNVKLIMHLIEEHILIELTTCLFFLLLMTFNLGKMCTIVETDGRVKHLHGCKGIDSKVLFGRENATGKKNVYKNIFSRLFYGIS
jgi:hypothetical protein